MNGQAPYYNKRINSGLCAMMVVAASSSALADPSLDELKARLERAEKENILLKAQRLERENLLIKAEQLETENKKLRGNMRKGTSQEALPADYKRKSAEQVAVYRGRNQMSRSINLSTSKNLSSLSSRRSNESHEAIGPSFDMAKSSPAVSDDDNWLGAYGGVNVGYGFGGSNQTSTTSLPLSDNTNSGVLPNFLAPDASIAFTQLAAFGASATATSGVLPLNQNGLIGGLQGGYNFPLHKHFLVGLEADIQGSTIQGNSGYSGIPSSTGVAYTISQPSGFINDVNQINSYSGGGSLEGGIDWVGTARGRLGWLPFQSLLLYATGGLAYGHAYAETSNAFILNSTLYQRFGSEAGGFTNVVSRSAFPSTGGQGRFSGNRTGWVAGGGLEWMFLRHWSLKGEALYYDLGSVQINSVPVGILGIISNVPSTKVHYDGVIARIGVNYHFKTDIGLNASFQ